MARRALLGLAVAALLIATCGGRLGGAAPTASTVAGSAIGTRILALVDTTRTLDTRRGGTSAPGRPLPTTVWYPATVAGRDAPAAKSVAPYPLIVFSHGLRGTPDDYAKLLESWAVRGYVVAAPTFPLTSRDSDPVVAGDLTNQPADVSFVITALLKASSDPKDALSGMVDPKRVIAAGHSEGAVTTVLLFAQCCAETRLAGAIILAGDDLGSQGKGFTAPPKPLLYIHGDADKIVAYALGQRSYAGAPEPKAFVTLLGGGHIDPYVRDASDAAADVVREATADFLAYVTGSAASDAHTALKTASSRTGVATFDDHLP